uniref:NADH dehydrogenase [ubiquinone] 1 alpha subcomplex subunit 3 n=1 Tax=Oryzias sinensis TaxID=183150 RepID=A0A8C7ZGC2_9TELE
MTLEVLLMFSAASLAGDFCLCVDNFSFNDFPAGIGAFLKNAWNKEPVILVSCGIGLIGVILPFVSPLTKDTAMINAAMPYNYPVPVRDDGNMPDVPAHPCEPKGRNLD